MTPMNDSISFTINEEQRMIQNLAREFSRNEIAPVAEQYDKSHEFPWPVVRKAQELGLTTMNIPEKYSGLGLNMLEECLVTEELSWGCSGISTAIGVNGLGMLPILIAGNEDQKMEYGERMADGQL